MSRTIVNTHPIGGVFVGVKNLLPHGVHARPWRAVTDPPSTSIATDQLPANPPRGTL